ncbi:hypothetical protein [Streptomyces fructofermentans]|uniref:Secreted protein n=1 Tax=Streptomyces fructofermentans TaxID=152141 RepID=A0A918N8H5_9ACTN|nr:hypothetical protein [Streptomyces fructofermentans]GGX47709.1 hypothetical protein GCM10010515_13490 [Streptomyces fructofermentans]
MNENPEQPQPPVTPEPAAAAEPVTVPEPAASVPEPVATPEPVAAVPVPGVPFEGVPAPAFVQPVPAPVPGPVNRPRRRGLIAAVVGSALLAGAVVAGTGYTVVTVNEADRDAGSPVWDFPRTTADDDDEPAPATGLAAMLVPYDEEDGWGRGPDLGEYGSDVHMSGAQAADVRKESLRDLPRSQRRRLERELDKQRIEGMAMRSYLGPKADEYVGSDEGFTVSVVLSRMESRAAVKGAATFQGEFLDTLDLFRKGPAIKGHKNAKCFLPPKAADQKLDLMFCSAYVGDVLVSATASGVKPLDTKGVAVFLRTQLDRITDPGEAV